MSYQVIARKWRPQTFEQLVGQNHVALTLLNSLKNNRIPHALLFTGPRGTGKTSSARILAKSLRCPEAVDFIPCGACPSCQDISVGRSVDVIEIDGASNNGVDAIRELRDTVVYAPSSGKYKIYIIDEVHMLSTSAFNALLKTLEEPPAHVIFILATTEVQKIPQTILSRCQRFDFRSISTKQIAASLKNICVREGYTDATEEALWMIARQGDGSMRDSQSLLDQVISFSTGRSITKESVSEILGLTDRSLILETVTSLIQRDAGQILKLLEKFFLAGLDSELFLEDILQALRDLLMIRMSEQVKTQSQSAAFQADQLLQSVELPDSEVRFFQTLGHSLPVEEIHFLFDMTLKGLKDLNTSSADQKILLEMILLRMVVAPQLVSLENLMQGSSLGGANTATDQAPRAASRIAMPQQVAFAQTVTAPAVAAATSHPASLTSAASVQDAKPHLSPNDLWPEKWLGFVEAVKKEEGLLGAQIENLLFIGENNRRLTATVPAHMNFIKDQIMSDENHKKIKSHLESYFGSGYALDIKAVSPTSSVSAEGTSAHNMANEKNRTQSENIRQQVADHPKVKQALSILKGTVGVIKDLDDNTTKNKS